MRIGIVSLFPDMFRALTEFGVVGKAVDRGLLQLQFANPRDFTRDKHRTVDDKPYGGGPGMVMKAQPLVDAVTHLRPLLAAQAPVIYLSPQGQPLKQAAVQRFSELPGFILVAGRYEGVDERFIDTCVDEQWSIGDYVVSGGELPAMLVIDAVTRLLPDVLGDELSAQQDSFTNGLLEYPQYTRPDEFEGLTVPSVLLSGDHEQIRRWRLQHALGRTWQQRPDLIRAKDLDVEQADLLAAYKQQHNEE